MTRRNKIRVEIDPAPAEGLKFSFQFYDKSDKYCFSCWEKGKIREALLRLRDISEKRLGELFSSREVLHFYPVYWSQTIEKNGFPDEKANSLEPYHFSLLGVNGQKARVYGALARDTFYIVWFDFDHKIWPVIKKHT